MIFLIEISYFIRDQKTWHDHSTLIPMYFRIIHKKNAELAEMDKCAQEYQKETYLKITFGKPKNENRVE